VRKRVIRAIPPRDARAATGRQNQESCGCAAAPGRRIQLEEPVAISHAEHEAARLRALEYLGRAGIILRDDEASGLEIADFGLGRLEREGLELITYINTDRCCAKELVLFPAQTCPEHRHPPLGPDNPGKEETFRCRWGEVYLHVPGPVTPDPLGRPPGPHYHLAREIVLRPGDQFTIPPDTSHWFQAGPDGAVVSEFSTRSTDEHDVFSDPAIRREPEILSPPV
jgi:D-lyxose ketol-isomerase